MCKRKKTQSPRELCLASDLGAFQRQRGWEGQKNTRTWTCLGVIAGEKHRTVPDRQTSRGVTLNAKGDRSRRLPACLWGGRLSAEIESPSPLHSGLFAFSSRANCLRSCNDRFEHLVALVPAEPLFVLLARNPISGWRHHRLCQKRNIIGIWRSDSGPIVVCFIILGCFHQQGGFSQPWATILTTVMEEQKSQTNWRPSERWLQVPQRCECLLELC